MRFATPIAVLALSPLWASCLDLEQRVQIRADGSGVQRLKLGLTEDVLAKGRAFAAALQGTAFSDPGQVFEASLVRREIAEAGLRCSDYKTYERRRRRFVEVEAEFGSLERLRKSPLNGSGAEWVMEPAGKNGAARLVFFPRGRAAWNRAVKKARAAAKGLGERERAFFARSRDQFQGLRVRWVLDLPGAVLGVGKGVSKTGERQVTVALDADSIRTPVDLIMLLAPRYEVTFDASATTLLADASPGEDRGAGR